MSERRDEIRRLVLAFGEGRAEAVCGQEALRQTRLLLCDAIRATDGQVELEADLLALAAWLFWCRWLALPDPEAEAEVETACRLFALVRLIDAEGLGASENVPEEIRELLDQEESDPVDLLVGEARGLLDELSHHFDPATMALSSALSAAALELLPSRHPRRPDVLSNLAASYLACYRATGDSTYPRQAVEACRTALRNSAPGPASIPHAVNLAGALETAYEASCDEQMLEEALRLYETLDTDDADAVTRARALTGHVATLFARYGLCGERGDLGSAIERCREARTLLLATGDGPRQGASAANLAELLRVRYNVDGDLADLDESARLAQEALRDTSSGDPDRPRRLSALASSLLARHEATSGATSGTEVADRAILLYEEAVSEAWPVDDRRPDYLSNLGHALVNRHQRTGAIRDLRRGIAAARLAVVLTPSTHPRLSVFYGNLGNAFVIWYERTGQIGLLDRGIEKIRHALTVAKREPEQRATLLSNLGGALFTRSVHGTEPGDLADALEANRTAVELSSPGCPDRSRRLANLALSLEQRFERLGDWKALDEAIEIYRTACDLASSDGTRRSHHLSALATALNVRYHLRGSGADLDEAVELQTHAAENLPDDHPDRSRRLANLASALLNRFRVAGNPQDVQAAADRALAAVSLLPDGHADLPYRLDMLGTAFTELARHTRRTSLCARAVSALTQAVEAAPAGDAIAEPRLRHLGDALELRFELAGDGAALDAAVTAFQRAVAACPPDLPDRALDLYSLGRALAARAGHADKDGAEEDLRAAVAAWRTAAHVRHAAVLVKLAAAEAWARTALTAGDPTAVDAFALAVELLPQLAWRGLPRADQERLLREWTGLAGDACAAAIAAGRPETAVELLDAGRSILWNQHLALRDDAADLARSHPELAARLRKLCGSIEALDAQAPSVVRHSARPRQDEPGEAPGDRRMSLSRKLDEVVAKIRGLEGFARFWHVPAYAELATIARMGPVVVVNVASLRCDALVIGAGGVDVVPLPLLSGTLAARAARRFLWFAGRMRRHAQLPDEERIKVSNVLRETLGYLWRAVAAPVIEHLGLGGVPVSPPRLWWCPTGPLSLLPLHAAQIYDHERQTDVGVIDHVISSYTPTLRALKAASERVPEPLGDHRLLVVAAAHVAEAEPLSHVDREVSEVLSAVGGRPTVLRDRRATRQAITTGLQRYGWLHFAGHSVQDTAEPGRSRILLADGGLTLPEIAALDLRHAELAYLSSCEGGTGTGTLPDEALHLASALQLAGYRHVIATTWTVDDASAAETAARVYARLFRMGETPAQAVHAAVSELRTSHPASSWAAYLHMGP